MGVGWAEKQLLEYGIFLTRLERHVYCFNTKILKYFIIQRTVRVTSLHVQYGFTRALNS